MILGRNKPSMALVLVLCIFFSLLSPFATPENLLPEALAANACDPGRDITITQDDNGKMITVNKDTRICLELKHIANTNGWDYDNTLGKELDESLLKKDGFIFTPPSTSGSIYGDIFGSVYGNVYGNVYGSIYGSVYGNVYGSVYGNVYCDSQNIPVIDNICKQEWFYKAEKVGATAINMVLGSNLSSCKNYFCVHIVVKDTKTPAPISIDDTNDREYFNISVGQLVYFNAPEGYIWKSSNKLDKKVLYEYLQPIDSGILNDADKKVWIYIANAPATNSLEFEYYKLSDPKKIIKNFRITLNAYDPNYIASLTPTPSPISLSGTNNGDTINISVGQYVYLSLISNIEDLYKWNPVKDFDHDVIFAKEPKSPNILANGKVIEKKTYICCGYGKTSIELKYSDPFNPQQFCITFDSQDPATPTSSPTPTPSVIKITEDNYGNTIDLSVNQYVYLTLKNYKFPGYNWNYTNPFDKNILFEFTDLSNDISADTITRKYICTGYGKTSLDLVYQKYSTPGLYDKTLSIPLNIIYPILPTSTPSPTPTVMEINKANNRNHIYISVGQYVYLSLNNDINSRCYWEFSEKPDKNIVSIEENNKNTEPHNLKTWNYIGKGYGDTHLKLVYLDPLDIDNIRDQFDITLTVKNPNPYGTPTIIPISTNTPTVTPWPTTTNTPTPTCTPTPTATDTPTPTLTPIVITQDDNEKTIHMAKNQKLLIVLKHYNDSSYKWKLLSPSDESILSLIVSEELPQSANIFDRIYEKATQYWLFKAIGDGRTTIPMGLYISTTHEFSVDIVVGNYTPTPTNTPAASTVTTTATVTTTTTVTQTPTTTGTQTPTPTSTHPPTPTGTQTPTPTISQTPTPTDTQTPTPITKKKSKGGGGFLIQSTTVTPIPTLEITDEPAPLFPIVLPDIKGHWAETAIRNLYAKQIINGYDDGTFKPNGIVSRAEAATLIVKSLNLPTSTDQKLVFSDNESFPVWASVYIQTAVDNGIINGYEDNTFRPSNSVTREEMAAIIIKAIKISDITATETTFSDNEYIGSWAKGFVDKASKLGIINGYEDSSFKPKNAISRAETSVIITNMLTLKPK